MHHISPLEVACAAIAAFYITGSAKKFFALMRRNGSADSVATPV